jgi:hypothetical protein
LSYFSIKSQLKDSQVVSKKRTIKRLSGLGLVMQDLKTGRKILLGGLKALGL